MIIIFGDPVSAEFKGALEGSTASDNQTTRPFLLCCFFLVVSSWGSIFVTVWKRELGAGIPLSSPPSTSSLAFHIAMLYKTSSCI